MSKSRPILSSRLRVELLQRQGHKLTIKADKVRAEIEVKRADGQRHTVTVTAEDLTPKRRNSQTFKLYPQSMLIAEAVHAACDWNDELDYNSKLETVQAVDPSGCVCTMCRDGQHVPLNRANDINIAYILLGKQRNNTGHNIDVAIEHVVTPEGDLDLFGKPHYAEARILDSGNLRRYNLMPWWDDIQVKGHF